MCKTSFGIITAFNLSFFQIGYPLHHFSHRIYLYVYRVRWIGVDHTFDLELKGDHDHMECLALGLNEWKGIITMLTSFSTFIKNGCQAICLKTLLCIQYTHIFVAISHSRAEFHLSQSDMVQLTDRFDSTNRYEIERILWLFFFLLSFFLCGQCRLIIS